jgi:P4 family phage/plasmid primase-like protien
MPPATQSLHSDSTMLDWALRYIRLGWPVFPLGVRSKLPMIPKDQGGNGCLDATLDEQKAREWWGRWPKANIGVATGHRFFVFDVDPLKGGVESIDFLKQHHGPLPDTVQQVTGSSGTHYLFQLSRDFTIPNTESFLGPGLDTRGYHGYIVAAPSVHPETKREYFWDGATEIEAQRIAPAPDWMIEKLRQHGQRSHGPVPVPVKIPKGQQHKTLVSIAGSLRKRGLDAEAIFAALKVVNETRCTEPGPERNIRRIADSVARYAPDARFDLFKAIPESDASDESPITPADVTAAVDDAITKSDGVVAMRLASEIAKLRAPLRAVEIAKLRLHFTKKAFPDFPWSEFNRALKEESGGAAEAAGSDGGDNPPAAAGGMEGGGADGPNLRIQPYTDAGNGERIVAMFGRDIRYCVEMKNWLLWDDKRWNVDTAGVILQKAKLMAREMYKQALGNSTLEDHARASESHRALKAAIACASTERGIPISASDLDQQAFLLNCPNGVVDLRSGTLLPHDREFLITKLCPIEYDAKAECPRFQAFLEWAMGGNPEADLSDRTSRLVGFLQRAFGYALTSDVSEKALFIFYGNKGNNGKTTLLTLFRHLLGKDYSSQISIETVMAAKSQDATMRADLADLRGARFVVTSEVEKEHRLNEGKIKFITAGLSEIKACRKYENPIEFPASHKLFMDCNHRPAVKGTDDAIWSRLKLVPFDVRVEKEAIDTSLPDKLRAELPGVLAWAVRGCQAWRRDGLGYPPEVAAASQEWREHDDPLKEFLEDCCEMGEELFTRATDLGTAYELWCKDNRERFPVGRESFNERLMAKGFVQSRGRRIDGKQARAWEGVALKPEMAERVRKQGVTKRAFDLASD